ncbi:butyrophilin-like protein 2 [Chanos chanos]|uniref:Butyrophilin-like protein 2 n=1 Tax=Chanos chanos TaxID=29144 RepID=A0A6J2WE21_CHACN|nr:butyrophilin-like protein 2 [Chanos chanos]
MWAWMFVSVPFCHAEVPETFSLLVPDGPVSAKLGSSVVLSCSLSPSFSAVELEVRWHRPNKFNTPVLLYKDQKIQESPVHPQYRDRVSLIGSLEEGNVSLKLENITLSDRGDYDCHVSSVTWYDKGVTSLTVNVLGSEPVLSFTETAQGNLNVTCVSDGWSPAPTVTWRDRKEKEINKNSDVIYSKDSEDLVSVSSWLLFSPSESEWISCSVSLSDQEKREGRVLPLRSKISNSATQPTILEPTASKPSWRAFTVMLVISLLSISVLFILLFILYKKRDPQKPVGTEPAVPEEGKEKERRRSAVELEVSWYRPSKFNTLVLLYKDLKIQESSVDPQYRERVSLIGSLEEGNVSQKLENITQSNRGEYESYVSRGTWYDKGTTSLSVNDSDDLPEVCWYRPNKFHTPTQLNNETQIQQTPAETQAGSL